MHKVNRGKVMAASSRQASSSHLLFPSQVIQAVFFGLCVLIDVSSLLTKAGDTREQERQLRKLVGLRDWMMAVLAFPVGAVRVHVCLFGMCACVCVALLTCVFLCSLWSSPFGVSTCTTESWSIPNFWTTSSLSGSTTAW